MTSVDERVGLYSGIKLTLDVPEGTLGLSEFRQLVSDLNFVAEASAVFRSEGPDAQGFVWVPVRVARISYNSPLTIVLMAGAGTSSLLAVLAYLRDWKSNRQSKQDDTDFKKFLYDEMKRELEKEGVSSDLVYVIASKLFGGHPEKPVNPKQPTEMAAVRRAYSAMGRLGKAIQDVEPTDEP
jgi:hypothetical protein